MELWIRSQDKERLIKVNQLEIRDDTYSNTKSGYSVASINFENTYGYNFINLGTYESKERALEVLDEINNYRDKLEKALFLGMTESEFVSSTYKMPNK